MALVFAEETLLVPEGRLAAVAVSTWFVAACDALVWAATAAVEMRVFVTELKLSN
jgi:hypothetical protein